MTQFESQTIQLFTFIPMSSCLVAPLTAPLAVLLRFYGPFDIETYFVFSLEGADPFSDRSHVCMDNCLPSCILVDCQRKCTVHGHQKHYCQFLGKNQNHQKIFLLLDFPRKFLVGFCLLIGFIALLPLFFCKFLLVGFCLLIGFIALLPVFFCKFLLVGFCL